MTRKAARASSIVGEVGHRGVCYLSGAVELNGSPSGVAELSAASQAPGEELPTPRDGSGVGAAARNDRRHDRMAGVRG